MVCDSPFMRETPIAGRMVTWKQTHEDGTAMEWAICTVHISDAPDEKDRMEEQILYCREAVYDGMSHRRPATVGPQEWYLTVVKEVVRSAFGKRREDIEREVSVGYLEHYGLRSVIGGLDPSFGPV